MQKYNDPHRTARMAWRLALGDLIWLILLSIGFGIGFGVSITNLWNANGKQDRQINQLSAQLAEVVMTTGNLTQITLLQNGTVIWGNSSDCGITGDYSAPVPYALYNVRIGPLNYTMLSVAPPPPPGLLIQSGTCFAFSISGFAPPIAAFAVFSATNVQFPLTSNNVELMRAACLSNGHCIESSRTGDSYALGTNSLGFDPGMLTLGTAGILGYLLQQSGSIAGSVFTIQDNWELLIPSL